MPLCYDYDVYARRTRVCHPSSCRLQLSLFTHNRYRSVRPILLLISTSPKHLANFPFETGSVHKAQLQVVSQG